MNCKYCRRRPVVEEGALCAICEAEAAAFFAKIMPTADEESLAESYQIGAFALGLVFVCAGAFVTLHQAGALQWPI
jgi:hypothetical protein